MVRLRNRDGTPVDPVPAFVVVLTAFVVVYAWGPLYLAALGFSLGQALAILTVAFVLLSAATFFRLVWAAKPALRAQVPNEYRFVRLLYAMAIGAVLVVLSVLPIAR